MRNITLALVVVLFCTIAQSAHSRDLQWSAAAPMSEARMGHAMVELPAGPNALGLSTGPGKVMVIGGFDSSPNAFPFLPANPLATCEIYDPETNVWTPAAPHPVSAGWRWSVVLQNGMVLVAGGIKNLATILAASHLYDPKTNRWIATKPLPQAVTNPHVFMRAIRLPNGRVLIAGGEDNNSIETAVLAHSSNSYLFTLNERNPSLSSWDYTRSAAGNKISRMPEGRTTSALVLLKDGRVLNVGGLGPAFEERLAATNTASIFNPATGLWTKTAPMPVITGLGEDEFVSPYPTAPGSRWAPFSEILDDGQVLIAGGAGGVFDTLRKSALLYDPTTETWRITTPMRHRNFFGSWSGALPSGAGILFAGPGFRDDFSVKGLEGEMFHPETRTWTPAPPVGSPPLDVDSFESKSLLLSTGRFQTTGGSDFATISVGISGSWIFEERNP